MIRSDTPPMSVHRSAPIPIPGRNSSSPRFDTTPYVPLPGGGFDAETSFGSTLPSTLYPQEHVFVLLGEDEEIVMVTFDPYSTLWGPQLITTYQQLAGSDAATTFITAILTLTGVCGTPHPSSLAKAGSDGGTSSASALTHINTILGTTALTTEHLGRWKRVTAPYMNVHVVNLCVNPPVNN